MHFTKIILLLATYEEKKRYIRQHSTYKNVNKWVRNFCLTHQFFQLFHGENKLIFNERVMRSTLYYTITHSCICNVLAHRNNYPLHTDTLSSFRANQSLLFIFNGTCSLRSNTHPYNIIIFGLTRSWWLRCDEIEQLSIWWYTL
jgi:hypothetical protein